MAGIDGIKDLVKPPFANYDVVVYFGCGFFALPFVFHYVGRPVDQAFKLDFGISPPFVGAVVATLTLLFSIYILGHVIAYLGSETIEKTMDSWFGKTSTIVCLPLSHPRTLTNTALRIKLRQGLLTTFGKHTWFSGVVRVVMHIPVLIPYVFVYWIGTFGFYRTRIGADVMERAQSRLSLKDITDKNVSRDDGWFKPLEAYVICNDAAATARMYNYLIISGLFRSVCFVLLCSDWVEFVQMIGSYTGYETPPGLMVLKRVPLEPHVAAYLVLGAAYMFCLASYLKFQRRYVEEAVFAFSYTKD